MFKLYDINNKEIECKILFTFKKNNKKFIIYLDNEKNILASFYKIDGDNLLLFPIVDDKDFDTVDLEIMKRSSL